jgi:uncharacterized membrane protein
MTGKDARVTLRSSERELTAVRVEALTDAVFAIVMTLLVLELHIPVADSPQALVNGLLEPLPKLVGFLLSFLVLGVYWVGQHNTFAIVRRVDRAFLWINIVYLMLISLVPFTTALLGSYPREPVAFVIYNVHLLVIGVVLMLHLDYATRNHRLMHDGVDPQRIRLARGRMLFALIGFVAALVASFLSTTVSFAILATPRAPFGTKSRTS